MILGKNFDSTWNQLLPFLSTDKVNLGNLKDQNPESTVGHKDQALFLTARKALYCFVCSQFWLLNNHILALDLREDWKNMGKGIPLDQNYERLYRLTLHKLVELRDSLSGILR